MKAAKILTLDSNVLVAGLQADEPYSKKCFELVEEVPESFVLSEPAVVYQEVCGTLARRLGKDMADRARRQLDLMISPALLANCDREFCTSSYGYCGDYGIYAIDALYLNAAIRRGAVLVSLDKEDFVDKVKFNHAGIEVYHVSDFPY